MSLDRVTDMEVVERTDGRFGIMAAGETEPDETIGTFDTREEAESWLFDRSERLEALRDEPGTLKPGSGQGLR